MTANGSNARGSQGGGDERRESLSRLNILIATTAAIVGLIYGAIRTYWYNGGRWPDETEARAARTRA
jgi:hypothetical protein